MYWYINIRTTIMRENCHFTPVYKYLDEKRVTSGNTECGLITKCYWNIHVHILIISGIIDSYAFFSDSCLTVNQINDCCDFFFVCPQLCRFFSSGLGLFVNVLHIHKRKRKSRMDIP